MLISYLTRPDCYIRFMLGICWIHEVPGAMFTCNRNWFSTSSLSSFLLFQTLLCRFYWALLLSSLIFWITLRMLSMRGRLLIFIWWYVQPDMHILHGCFLLFLYIVDNKSWNNLLLEHTCSMLCRTWKLLLLAGACLKCIINLLKNGQIRGLTCNLPGTM